MGVDRESCLFKGLYCLPLCGYGFVCVGDIVDEDVKRSLCDDAGVELSYAACGCVSWVGKYGELFLLLCGVELGESLFRDVDFSAYFDGVEGGGVESERYASDGFDVLGDVVAFDAVSSCCSSLEYAVFVPECDADAVYFWFDDVFDVSDVFSYSGVEFLEFVEVVGVV